MNNLKFRVDNLKFRAWDKTAKKMLKVTVIDFSTEPFRVFCRAYGNENYFNKDVILTQSTGLFDKNGKEIFEGDIVVKYGNYFIITQMATGCWKLSKKECDGCWYIDLYDICDYVEVIGNIYENKELIENKELLRK